MKSPDSHEHEPSECIPRCIQSRRITAYVRSPQSRAIGTVQHGRCQPTCCQLPTMFEEDDERVVGQYAVLSLFTVAADNHTDAAFCVHGIDDVKQCTSKTLDMHENWCAMPCSPDDLSVSYNQFPTANTNMTNRPRCRGCHRWPLSIVRTFKLHL